MTPPQACPSLAHACAPETSSDTFRHFLLAHTPLVALSHRSLSDFLNHLRRNVISTADVKLRSLTHVPTTSPERNRCTYMRQAKAVLSLFVLLAATIPTHAQPSQAEPGTANPGKMTNPKDGQVYVWIPPGTFNMGCSEGDTECYPVENPPHSERIANGFWLGQTLVTK
jgi:hypothetical protein